MHYISNASSILLFQILYLFAFIKIMNIEINNLNDCVDSFNYVYPKYRVVRYFYPIGKYLITYFIQKKKVETFSWGSTIYMNKMIRLKPFIYGLNHSYTAIQLSYFVDNYVKTLMPMVRRWIEWCNSVILSRWKNTYHNVSFIFSVNQFKTLYFTTHCYSILLFIY